MKPAKARAMQTQVLLPVYTLNEEILLFAFTTQPYCCD